MEAFSMLFPKGWIVQGGVRWRGVQECRGDIVSNHVKATSPDGLIRYEAMPSRTFTWTGDQMMLQAMQAGAQSGGCQLNQPFDAARYIEGYARRDLGATATDIRSDESKASFLQQLDAQANATSRQYGNDLRQETTMAFGKLAWPEGNQGILHVGVTNLIARTSSTTSVFYCTVMRFPAARKDEATKLFGMLQSSFRQNPIWKQAKEQFLTQL